MTSTRPFLASPGPTVAVEIASTRVAAASVVERGGRSVVVAHAVEPLPAGVVTPSLNASNIANRSAVSQALEQVFGRLGFRPRRVGLVVPDSMAKVSLVRFEKVPVRPRDLEQLVRWQVRKTAPFRIEDARVSYTAGAATPEGGREYVVALARRDLIEEYENICSGAGAHAGLVDIATFNVINTILAGETPPASDWLLVHVDASYTSIAIVRGSDLIFFRNRPSEEEGSLADLVHQTSMYYEDRLGGGGFSRVFLAGVGGTLDPADVEYIRRNLEERLGTRVDAVDPREAAALADRLTVGPALLDTLAPLVGLLVRARAA